MTMNWAPFSRPNRRRADRQRHGDYTAVLRVVMSQIVSDLIRVDLALAGHVRMTLNSRESQKMPTSTALIGLALACTAISGCGDAARAVERQRVVRLPVDLRRAPATPLPLHMGAARYYRERELFQ
jgi:hypothetical protein